jgi:hypothetical protein
LFVKLLLVSQISQGQLSEIKKVDLDKIQIEKPDILSTHPLSVFSMRKGANFKLYPDKFSITASLSNGNIMLPNVNIYYAKNDEDLAMLKEMPWHYRDPSGIESDMESLYVDGLMRIINLHGAISIGTKHEIKVTMRSLFFESGSMPFTILNSDAFIEGFHDNIYGGPDPFARRVYGFDKAEFHYVNIKGEEFTIHEDEFLISGIEFSYYYYPEWKKTESRNIYQNMGAHLGINPTDFNTSVDGAITYAFSKLWMCRNNRTVAFSVGLTGYYNQLIKMEDAQQVYSDNFNGMAEGMLTYIWRHKRKDRTFSVSIDYIANSTFRKGYSYLDDYNGLIFEGEQYTSHWYTTASQLLRSTQTWSFIYAWQTPKMVISFYLQEDLLVNNAPDTQTGISVKWKLR